jgi:hypothetical protein
MSALQIEPAEGLFALEFLDDEEEETEEQNQTAQTPYPEPTPREGCFAIVVGVGKKITGYKRGDTVIVDSYARNGLKIGNNVVLVESYLVKGKVTAK